MRQAAEQRPPMVDSTTTASPFMVDNNTNTSYLVVGVGLAHGSSQTEHDAWARAVMDGDLTQEEACWMRSQDASGAPLEPQEQVDSADAQPEELTPPEPPPPVFADCSDYYMSTPARRPQKEKQRSQRALVW